MNFVTGKSLYFNSPKQIAIVEESIASPTGEQLLVQTDISAISPGTEMLFYRNMVPTGIPVDVTIPALSGVFSYPIKYGYASVGRVIALGSSADQKWLNQRVFSFHPHESHYLARAADLIPVPHGLSAEHAVFLPSVETALALVMDGRPVIGERVLVFGQGIIGLLTTEILGRFPLSNLVTVDPIGTRRELSVACGAQASYGPDAREELLELDADLAFEVSGNPSALDLALSAVGNAGRVIIGSWYGAKPATLNLDSRFHRSRIRMLSSQVSSIDPEFSGRWTKRRRMDFAWRLLSELDTSVFVTHRYPIERASDAFDLIDKQPAQVIQVLLTYDRNTAYNDPVKNDRAHRF